MRPWLPFRTWPSPRSRCPEVSPIRRLPGVWTARRPDRAGLSRPGVAPHPPPLSGPEAAGSAAPGLFGVQAIKCARIPATQQGARERGWKRRGPRLLICLSIKGARGPRGSAGRRGEAGPGPSELRANARAALHLPRARGPRGGSRGGRTGRVRAECWRRSPVTREDPEEPPRSRAGAPLPARPRPCGGSPPAPRAAQPARPGPAPRAEEASLGLAGRQRAERGSRAAGTRGGRGAKGRKRERTPFLPAVPNSGEPGWDSPTPRAAPSQTLRRAGQRRPGTARKPRASSPARRGEGGRARGLSGGSGWRKGKEVEREDRRAGLGGGGREIRPRLNCS